MPRKPWGTLNITEEMVVAADKIRAAQVSAYDEGHPSCITARAALDTAAQLAQQAGQLNAAQQASIAARRGKGRRERSAAAMQELQQSLGGVRSDLGAEARPRLADDIVLRAQVQTAALKASTAAPQLTVSATVTPLNEGAFTEFAQEALSNTPVRYVKTMKRKGKEIKLPAQSVVLSTFTVRKEASDTEVSSAVDKMRDALASIIASINDDGDASVDATCAIDTAADGSRLLRVVMVNRTAEADPLLSTIGEAVEDNLGEDSELKKDLTSVLRHAVVKFESARPLRDYVASNESLLLSILEEAKVTVDVTANGAAQKHVAELLARMLSVDDGDSRSAIAGLFGAALAPGAVRSVNAEAVLASPHLLFGQAVANNGRDIRSRAALSSSCNARSAATTAPEEFGSRMYSRFFGLGFTGHSVLGGMAKVAVENTRRRGDATFEAIAGVVGIVEELTTVRAANALGVVRADFTGIDLFPAVPSTIRRVMTEVMVPNAIARKSDDELAELRKSLDMDHDLEDYVAGLTALMKPVDESRDEAIDEKIGEAIDRHQSFETKRPAILQDAPVRSSVVRVNVRGADLLTSENEAEVRAVCEALGATAAEHLQYTATSNDDEFSRSAVVGLAKGYQGTGRDVEFVLQFEADEDSYVEAADVMVDLVKAGTENSTSAEKFAPVYLCVAVAQEEAAAQKWAEASVEDAKEKPTKTTVAAVPAVTAEALRPLFVQAVSDFAAANATKGVPGTRSGPWDMQH